jgi:hypothetical protein
VEVGRRRFEAERLTRPLRSGFRVGHEDGKKPDNGQVSEPTLALMMAISTLAI